MVRVRFDVDCLVNLFLRDDDTSFIRVIFNLLFRVATFIQLMEADRRQVVFADFDRRIIPILDQIN